MIAFKATQVHVFYNALFEHKKRETFVTNKCNQIGLLCDQTCEKRLDGVLWLTSISFMLFFIILLHTMCFVCQKLLIHIPFIYASGKRFYQNK